MKIRNPHGRVVSVTEDMYRRYSKKKGWQPVTESYPKHVGGGMYELSDGSRVKGKKKAIEAEADVFQPK